MQRIIMFSFTRFFLSPIFMRWTEPWVDWLQNKLFPSQTCWLAHSSTFIMMHPCNNIFWRQPNPRVSWYFRIWRCLSIANPSHSTRQCCPELNLLVLIDEFHWIIFYLCFLAPKLMWNFCIPIKIHTVASDCWAFRW